MLFDKLVQSSFLFELRLYFNLRLVSLNKDTQDQNVNKHTQEKRLLDFFYALFVLAVLALLYSSVHLASSAEGPVGESTILGYWSAPVVQIENLGQCVEKPRVYERSP